MADAFCSYCSIRLNTGANFCYKCGAAVTVRKVNLQSLSKEEPPSTRLAVDASNNLFETATPGKRDERLFALQDTATNSQARTAYFMREGPRILISGQAVDAKFEPTLFCADGDETHSKGLAALEVVNLMLSDEELANAEKCLAAVSWYQ